MFPMPPAAPVQPSAPVQPAAAPADPAPPAFPPATTTAPANPVPPQAAPPASPAAQPAVAPSALDAALASAPPPAFSQPAPEPAAAPQLVPSASGPAVASAPPAAKPKKRRPIGWIIAVVMLVLALGGVGYLLWDTLQQLDDAKNTIDEQKDLIDKKDTFTTSMQALVDETAGFEGTKVGQLVPEDRIDLLAARAYTNRWDGSKMDDVTAQVDQLHDELVAQLAEADDQKTTNKSHSKYESVIDKLGAGFVRVKIDNADKLCKEDVLGCVTSDDPYTIHIDKADTTLEFMTDFLKSGISYHEFAHVLQYTHPAESDQVAKDSFRGDYETMADCFALTYLKGWKLHHTIFVSTYTYYEVDLGYGYTCNSKQKKAIKAWYEGLDFVPAEVTS